MRPCPFTDSSYELTDAGRADAVRKERMKKPTLRVLEDYLSWRLESEELEAKRR